MLKKDVQIGKCYKIQHGNELSLTTVRIVRPLGSGYEAVKLSTGRTIRIKSAAKLRYEVGEVMADGYRVITTSYKFVLRPEDAYDLAIQGRRDGKLTEIISEDEYQEKHYNRTSMSDLLNWRRVHVRKGK